MRWYAQIVFYLKSLFQKKKLDAQLSEEVRTHVEMATEANVAAGMSPEEARYAALRQFGNVASIQEQAREGRGWLWLEQFWKDVGFVVRSAARARGSSLVILATLVLGIGMAAVVFSLSYKVLFGSLPYPEPERLVSIASEKFPNGCLGVQFQAYQELSNVFAGFVAEEVSTSNVLVEGSQEVAPVMHVSVDCFDFLGIRPVLGRGFRPEEHRAGAANVALISDRFWRKNFQASPEVLGRQIVVNQQTCSIIGVVPAGQVFPGPMGDVYCPLVLKVDPAQPFAPWLFVVGRLRAGVTREQATAALSTVKLPGLPQWAEVFFSENRPMVGPVSLISTKPYWLMLAGGVLLYVSACLNAMNLMFARLLSRQRELGIRLALGGSHWQVARLLLIESMGLALLAGLVVTLGWRWLCMPLYSLLAGGSVTVEAADYWPAVYGVLGVAVILSVVAGAMVSMVPVWRLLKTGVDAALKEGGPGYGESPRMAGLRSALVVIQAAFAVILLVGMGLMVRSFERLHRVDLGFDAIGKVKVNITFPRDYAPEPEKRLQLFERIAERLKVLPGVKDITYGGPALLDGEYQGEQFKLPDGKSRMIAGHAVAANYAQVVGLTLIQGRWFAPRRGNDVLPVEVVINETMKRQIFDGRDPLGQMFPGRPYLVVGVVHDVRGSVREPVGSHYYWPVWRSPQSAGGLVLRMETDPPVEFTGIVQRAIYAVEPKVIVPCVFSVTEWIGRTSMQPERFAYTILRGVTPIGLGLAALGLFSVLAYNVDTRRKEFGVRLALGARPGDLHRLVMRRGLATAAFGVALGIAAALGVTRYIQSLLFETTPYEPIVYGGVVLVLLGAAALACWLPARRAAKVDPVIALRAE